MDGQTSSGKLQIRGQFRSLAPRHSSWALLLTMNFRTSFFPWQVDLDFPGKLSGYTRVFSWKTHDGPGQLQGNQTRENLWVSYGKFSKNLEAIFPVYSIENPWYWALGLPVHPRGCSLELPIYFWG